MRDRWAEGERVVGGKAPELSDDEIAAIGTSICKYFAAHPLAVHTPVTSQERMEAYTDVSVMITDALGIPYDPALQDAGFEARSESRKVLAFKHTMYEEENWGLCPPPTSGPGSMPCSQSFGGCPLFASPWSATASPK